MDSVDRHTLDLLSAFVILVDAGGKIVHWNQACSNLSRMELAQARGRELGAILTLPEGLDLWSRADGARSFESWWTLETGARHVIAFSAALDRTAQDGALLTLTGVDVSEQVVQRDLERVRLRMLLDQAPDGIFVANLEGRYTDVNDAGCRLLGYPREEIIGKTIADFIPKEDIPRLGQARREMMQGVVHIGDWSLRRRDGSYLSVEVSSKILPDGRWQGFVRDISERKQFEASLRRAAEERQVFIALIENSSDFIGIADANGKPFYVNPAGRRMVGLDADHPVETTEIADYYPVDQRSFVSEVILKSMVEKGRWRGETYFLNFQTQEAIPVSDEHFVIREAQSGQVLGLGTVTRDISDIKRAVEAMRMSEERLKFVLEEAGETLMLAARNDECMMKEVAQLLVKHLADWCFFDIAESQGIRRLKVACAEPRNQHLAEKFERLQLDRNRSHLMSEALLGRRAILLTEVSPEVLESMAQTPEHLQMLRELEIGSLIVVPLESPDRLLGALALIASKGSRRYSEQELGFAKALARLLTLALEGAYLYRDAQQAAAARDEVLGIVAHDLRSPLQTILLQCQLMMLRGGDLDKRSTAAIEAIERAARRMNRLIENMLDVASLEGGALHLARGPLPAGRLLDEVREELEQTAHKAGLQMRCETPEALPTVMGDRDRLLRVFDNLISNAIKFTHRGGTVILGAAPRPGEVLFWVSDTGSGIEPDHLEHIFDRFWQSDPRDHGGAGLGLFIVRGIVEAHGGRIWGESQLGLGTTFFFTVPSVLSDNAHAEGTQPG